MSKQITCYLAHPRLEKERGKDLQKKIEALGIKVLNPFERPEEQKYDQVIKTNRKFSMSDCANIVEGDLRKIEEADILVALVTGKASAGTHMEVFYAARILHRPVYVLYEFIHEGQNIHPWYNYLTSCYTREEDLLEVLAPREIEE